MKFISLNYDDAHKVVDSNRFLNWDGWDIVTRRKSPGAWMDKRGIFADGQWWLQFRYPVRSNGTWEVPDIYVNR